MSQRSKSCKSSPVNRPIFGDSERFAGVLAVIELGEVAASEVRERLLRRARVLLLNHDAQIFGCPFVPLLRSARIRKHREEYIVAEIMSIFVTLFFFIAKRKKYNY